MEFSPDDKDLVDIVVAVEEIAFASKQKKKEGQKCIDVSVKRYLNNYLSTHSTLPNRSVFGEAINWYIDEKYRGKVPDMVQSVMRKIVLESYDKFREAYYRKEVIRV